jgi:hypothetical protein
MVYPDFTWRLPDCVRRAEAAPALPRGTVARSQWTGACLGEAVPVT